MALETSDARRIVEGIAPRFVPRRAEPPLAPQAPAEERSSGRPYGKRAGALEAAVAAEVHAGTPKNQTLANYPASSVSRPQLTRCPVIL
jgi:hypothetical protein